MDAPAPPHPSDAPGPEPAPPAAADAPAAPDDGEAGTADPASDPHAAAGPTVCPNCRTSGTGDFCAGCGQRHRRERLTLRGLWADFASRAFSLDAGLLLTLRRLAGGPGRVPADYIDGLQRRYTHPLSFYLLTAAVYLFSFGLFQEDLVRELGAEGSSIVQIDTGDDAEAAADGEPSPDATTASDSLSVGARIGEAVRVLDGDGTGTMRRVTQIQRQITTPLLVFFALFLVAPLRLLFGPRRNVAEIAIFSLYVVGSGTLLIALLAPVMFWTLPPRIAAVGQSALTFVAYPAVVAWAAGAFWARGWRTVLKATVAVFIGLVVYSLASGLLSLLILLGELLESAGLTWRELIGS